MPEYASCPCCGPDFRVEEYKTIEEATEYERNWDRARGTAREDKIDLQEYLDNYTIFVLRKDWIDEKLLVGPMPRNPNADPRPEPGTVKRPKQKKRKRKK